MKYCKECGSELNDQHDFCTNCGTKQIPSTPQEPLQQSKRNPMRKRTKIMIGATAAFVILLFGVHIGLSSYFDPMKDLQAMEQAITSDNATEFMTYIEFDDKALLNEETYFNYVKENEWESVRTQYMEILKDKNELTSKINSINGQLLFTVQPNKHLFGLYTTYTFKAHPSTLTVHTALNNTEVSISEATETMNASKEKEFKLYPGIYTIKANANTIYGEFTYSDSIEIGAQQAEEMELNFDGNTYSFRTNQPKATLFVNNKDSGLTLGEIDFLGPFPEDTEVNMHAEWKTSDGDVIKSDIVTQRSAGVFGGVPFVFDETKSEVATSETPNRKAGDTVLHFRDAYEKAVNNKDYSLIKPFMKKDSDASEDLKEYIHDLKDTDYAYNFTSNKVLTVEEMDSNTVEVMTNEKFIFTNHRDEQTEYDREKVYTLIFENGSYQITKIEYVKTNRDEQ